MNLKHHDLEPPMDEVEDFARQLDAIVRIQDQEEEEDHFGYQQLPQDQEEEESHFEYQQLPQEDDYQPLDSGDEEEEQHTVMKEPLHIRLDPSTSLNPETSDYIKSIMSNIQLSDDAIPEWAKKIPESAWLPKTRDEQ